MKGSRDTDRSWPDLPSLRGTMARLSATDPAVPVELWHCDGDFVGEIHGFTPAVTTGTAKWTLPFYGFPCAQFDGATEVSMAAYESSLNILGDKTIVAIVAMHSLASSVGSAGAVASFAGTTSSETTANNIIYSAGFWDAGVWWLSEHGSGTDDLISLPGHPPQSQMAICAWRLSSNVLTTWVNGRILGGPSSAGTTPTGGTAGVFSIGCLPGSPNHRAVMTLGGLAVYSSALSDAALLAQADAVLAGMRHA